MRRKSDCVVSRCIVGWRRTSTTYLSAVDDFAPQNSLGGEPEITIRVDDDGRLSAKLRGKYQKRLREAGVNAETRFVMVVERMHCGVRKDGYKTERTSRVSGVKCLAAAAATIFATFPLPV